MLYREERSEKIQVKGASSEREIEEQRKRRNMKTVRKRGKKAVEGRTVHELGKNFMGEVEKGKIKSTWKRHKQHIVCSYTFSPAQSPLYLPISESSCWPWASWDTPLMPWLLLVLTAGFCVPYCCHPIPGQYTQVPGQLLSYGFQN